MCAAAMSTQSSCGSRQQQAPKALLGGPSASGRYRRSSTVKAPRKRTFLLAMQKPSALALNDAVGRVSATSAAVVGKDTFSVCFGGNDGGKGGNSNGKRWGGDGGASQPGRSSPSPAAWIGALALSFACFAAPMPSMAAASTHEHGAAHVASGYIRVPKAIQLRSATLVIPNAAHDSAVARGVPQGRIVYGAVQLTREEKGLLRTQYHGREAVTVA